jgi:hypothetical protein
VTSEISLRRMADILSQLEQLHNDGVIEGCAITLVLRGADSNQQSFQLMSVAESGLALLGAVTLHQKQLETSLLGTAEPSRRGWKPG